LNDKSYLKYQNDILRQMKDWFEESLASASTIGFENWQRRLLPNMWQEPLTIKLESVVAEFQGFHSRCTSDNLNRSFFKITANGNLAAGVSVIREAIAERESSAVWSQLFKFGRVLADTTLEVLEGNRQPGEKEEAFESRKRREFLHKLNGFQKPFSIMSALRNRHSHPYNEDKLGEWFDLQGYVAEILGRYWHRHPRNYDARSEQFGKDHLGLTALEGTEVKVVLLQRLSDGLEFLLGDREHR
jgi:hypothetical protein